MKLTKNHLYNILVGQVYEFQIFEVIDAAKQIYYIGSPVGRGGTKTADTIEELRKKLELQVEPLNMFTEVIEDCQNPIEPVEKDYDIEKYNEIDDRYFCYSEPELPYKPSKDKNNKKTKKPTKRTRTKSRRDHLRPNGWTMQTSRCH